MQQCTADGRDVPDFVFTFVARKSFPKKVELSVDPFNTVEQKISIKNSTNYQGHETNWRKHVQRRLMRASYCSKDTSLLYKKSNFFLYLSRGISKADAWSKTHIAVEREREKGNNNITKKKSPFSIAIGIKRPFIWVYILHHLHLHLSLFFTHSISWWQKRFAYNLPKWVFIRCFYSRDFHSLLFHMSIYTRVGNKMKWEKKRKKERKKKLHILETIRASMLLCWEMFYI